MLSQRLKVLVSAVGALRPQQHRVTVVTSVLDFEEACFGSVKSQVALKTTPHLGFGGLKAAVVVHVPGLVPCDVSENGLQAPVIAADPLRSWHRSIEKAERHFYGSSSRNWPGLSLATK
jgi:hypothetical protein